MREIADIRIPPELSPATGASAPDQRKSVKKQSMHCKPKPGSSWEQVTVKRPCWTWSAGCVLEFVSCTHFRYLRSRVGNGGTTIFWDALTFGFIENKSQHLSFGEFSTKFAAETKAAPFLADPEVITSDYGTHPEPVAREDVTPTLLHTTKPRPVYRWKFVVSMALQD